MKFFVQMMLSIFVFFAGSIAGGILTAIQHPEQRIVVIAGYFLMPLAFILTWLISAPVDLLLGNESGRLIKRPWVALTVPPITALVFSWIAGSTGITHLYYLIIGGLFGLVLALLGIWEKGGAKANV